MLKNSYPIQKCYEFIFFFYIQIELWLYTHIVPPERISNFFKVVFKLVILKFIILQSCLIMFCLFVTKLSYMLRSVNHYLF